VRLGNNACNEFDTSAKWGHFAQEQAGNCDKVVGQQHGKGNKLLAMHMSDCKRDGKPCTVRANHAYKEGN
jgi:hypothetical protein